nr:hypothetical protein [Brevibacterium sandarakinum]
MSTPLRGQGNDVGLLDCTDPPLASALDQRPRARVTPHITFTRSRLLKRVHDCNRWGEEANALHLQGNVKTVRVPFQAFFVIAMDRVPTSHSLTCGSDLDGVSTEMGIEDIGVLLMESVFKSFKH